MDELGLLFLAGGEMPFAQRIAGAAPRSVSYLALNLALVAQLSAPFLAQ
jgi:hypothetical protein